MLHTFMFKLISIGNLISNEFKEKFMNFSVQITSNKLVMTLKNIIFNPKHKTDRFLDNRTILIFVIYMPNQ